MKFLKMNSVKCMSLEQNPALSTVCPGPGINNFDVSLRPILSAIGIADYNLNNFFFTYSFCLNSILRIIFHLLQKSVLLPIATLISWLALISSLYLQISLRKKLCPLQLNITITRPSRNFTPKLFKDLLYHQ